MLGARTPRAGRFQNTPTSPSFSTPGPPQTPSASGKPPRHPPSPPSGPLEVCSGATQMVTRAVVACQEDTSQSCCFFKHKQSRDQLWGSCAQQASLMCSAWDGQKLAKLENKLQPPKAAGRSEGRTSLASVGLSGSLQRATSP